MNQPQSPPDYVPAEPDTPATDPNSKTPHGIPKGMEDHDPKGSPNSDRAETETAVSRIEKS